MTRTKDFTEQFPFEENNEPQMHLPAVTSIESGTILLTRENAASFHSRMKSMIMETGHGLFEYLETVKFFEKIKDVINGNSQAKVAEDKEFIDMVRTEIAKYEGGKFTSSRGVKFELAETGHKLDYTNCNDPELLRLEQEAKAASDKLKERQEFLKNLPSAGVDVLQDGGEVVKVYPPAKSSKSSYKMTLPKS